MIIAIRCNYPKLRYGFYNSNEIYIECIEKVWSVELCLSITMESYKSFYKFLFVWNRNMLKSLGHDIYDENFKAGLPTYLFMALMFVVFYCMFDTIINKDSFTGISCIFYIALNIQVSVLLLVFTTFSFKGNYSNLEFDSQNDFVNKPFWNLCRHQNGISQLFWNFICNQFW